MAASELVAVSAEKAMIPGVSRDAVSFTFPLDAQAVSLTAATPYEARSREYFVEVDAADLRAGVELFTTAPGALVRINPAAGVAAKAEAPTVDPASLVIRTAAGDAFTAGKGMSLLADAEQMKATGVPFVAGTTAFRLSPEVGVGSLVVAAPGLESEARYAVHVFDAQSDTVLSLQASGLDFFHGQEVRVNARFEDAAGAFAADFADGFVVAPNGRAWDVQWTADRHGGLSAALPLDALAGAGQGLWQVHMAARGDRDGLTVIRNASTSFAAHLPTAALTGEVRMGKAMGLAVELGVAVASPGRYEVRGVVFGTDAAGQMVPFAAAHSANWLDADGSLTLTVEPQLLRDAGVGAPFEVRDLRLLDQGRMGVLHRQARGLVIER